MRLIRGMALDLQIAQLIASVTTALDEYRNQIQAEHDDGVAVEDERQLPEKQSTASLGLASSEIIKSANALDRDFEDKGFGATTSEDTLRRRVQDSANLSRMARAQLQLRPIVSRWYKATWKAVKKLPKLIEQAGRGIDITREITDQLALLGNSFETQGHAPQKVAGFLMRCLFSMFAEDVDLIPHESFTARLKDMQANPANAAPALQSLWETMDKGGFSPVLRTDLLRFNGGLFAEAKALPLDSQQIALLIGAANKD